MGLSRDQVEKLLLSVIQATSAAEIRQVMNMTNATKFKRNYIDPLLELRILAMTQPDSPKSPTQKYYLTELGKQLIKNTTVQRNFTIRSADHHRSHSEDVWF